MSQAEILPEPVRREAQSRTYQQHADQLAEGRDARESGVESTDPNYVTELEAFGSFSHEEIYGHVQTMNPGMLSAAARQWFTAASGLSGAVTAGVIAALAELKEGWEGATAKTVDDAIRSLSVSGRETYEVMTSVVSRLNQASYAAEALKAAVPPPEPPVSVADTAMALIAPSAAFAVKQAAERREAARQEAIRAMESIYVGTMKPIGDAVPAFVSPTDPTSEGTGGGAEIRGGGSGSFGSAGSAASPGTSGSGAEASAAAGQAASTGFPSESAAGQGLSSTDTRDAGAGSGAGSLTSPAATATATDSSTAAGSGYGSVANGSGSGAGGSASGFLGGAGARRDERKREGADGLTGRGIGALGGMMAGAVAAGGDSLRPGQSVAATGRGALSTGMMPAGHRGHREEDKEHETPSYLVNANNGNELIGGLAPTAPPVIGAWDQT